MYLLNGFHSNTWIPGEATAVMTIPSSLLQFPLFCQMFWCSLTTICLLDEYVTMVTEWFTTSDYTNQICTRMCSPTDHIDRTWSCSLTINYLNTEAINQGQSNSELPSWCSFHTKVYRPNVNDEYCVVYGGHVLYHDLVIIYI